MGGCKYFLAFFTQIFSLYNSLNFGGGEIFCVITAHILFGKLKFLKRISDLFSKSEAYQIHRSQQHVQRYVPRIPFGKILKNFGLARE